MMIFDGCQLGFKTWIYVRQYHFEEIYICLQNISATPELTLAHDSFDTAGFRISDLNENEYTFEDYLTWASLICAFFHCCFCFIFNHLELKIKSSKTERQTIISNPSISELRSGSVIRF